MVSSTVTTMLIHRGMPNHKNRLANKKDETVARVQADMSKPSGAMVMVAPMAKIVVMDMERRIFTMLAAEKKLPPRSSENAATAAASAITAAQSMRNPGAYLWSRIWFKRPLPLLSVQPGETELSRQRNST